MAGTKGGLKRPVASKAGEVILDLGGPGLAGLACEVSSPSAL